MKEWEKVAKEIKKEKEKYYERIDKKAKDFENEYGFNYADTWSLDHLFCLWIVPRLMYLREERTGTPVLIVPEDGDMTKFDTKVNEEAWNAILDEMIEGFYECGVKGEFGFLQSEEDEVKLQKSFELFTKYHNHLWD